MLRNTKRMGRWIAIAVAIGLFCCSEATAKKPPKPPGDDGGNGGGVIYFTYDGDLYTMNDDGSGILPVAGYPDGFRLPKDASRHRHAEKRWFTQMIEVPDEYYPDFKPDGTYKDFAEREILVVLSDAGDAVPVWIDAGLEPLEEPKWTVGDGYLSWVGRRWDIDPESEDYGEVLEGGLYATKLAFDTAGNVTGMDGPSFLLFPSSPLVPSNAGRQAQDFSPGPDIWRHDWAPDGIHFVFEPVSTEELRIGQIGGDSELLYFEPSGGSVGWPKWSPAGDSITFHSRGQLMVIRADGSRVKTLVRGNPNWSVGGGVWSPTGSHLLYQHWDHFFQDTYIVRITAGGGGKARLTDKSMGWGVAGPRPLGWRE